MRLDLYVERGLVFVTLSRRNLLACLAKLEEPGSFRMITGRYVYVNGELIDELTLVLRAQPDDEHYQGREPAGPMAATTERRLEELAESRPSANVEQAVGDLPDDDSGQGIAPSRHPPGRVLPWVFQQHQIWVDTEGHEQEIEIMPSGIVDDVIRFCEVEAGQINFVCLLAALSKRIDASVAEQAAPGDALLDEFPAGPNARKWIEGTPLMHALRRRREILRNQQPPAL